MIKHVFLKTGYAESNSNGYLYLCHRKGFATKEEVFKSLYDAFKKTLEVGHNFDGHPEAFYCGQCGLTRQSHNQSDSEEIAELVVEFASGVCDGTGEIWEALQSCGWDTFMDVMQLRSGEILYISEYGEQFVVGNEFHIRSADAEVYSLA